MRAGRDGRSHGCSRGPSASGSCMLVRTAAAAALQRRGVLFQRGAAAGWPSSCVVPSMAPKEKQRGAGQPRSAHYSSSVRIVNVDNASAAPSVLLHLERQRYLFNAGEGIQRHFTEHKMKLKKVSCVLATRVHTDTLAGLPGMLLSQVEVGNELGRGSAPIQASLCGPSGLRQYADAFRMYASSFGLTLTELDAGSDSKPVVTDPYITITPVLLSASSSKREAAAAEPEPAAAAAEPPSKKPRHDASDGSAADADQPTAGDAAGSTDQEAKPQRTAAAAAAAAASTGGGMATVSSSAGAAPLAACYVCQLANVPGKFDPKKAAQLGVPKGPMFGQLQRGEAVTALSGKTVQPHEVMDPPTMQGACVVVVDCPSTAYLPSLQDSALMQQLQQESQQQEQQQQAAAGGTPRKSFVVVHLGPASVTSGEAYSSWVSHFGPSVTHLRVGSDTQLVTTTRKAAAFQAQLNLIEPEVFPLTGFHSAAAAAAAAAAAPLQPPAAPAADAQMQEAAAATGGVADAVDGYSFTLAPIRNAGLQVGSAALTTPPDLAAVQAEVRAQHPAVMQLLGEYQAAKAAAVQQQQEQGQPPRELQGIGRTTCAVTPLGTCSACPSNHRNVSAYYMDLFERGGLLMDCGEDTMGQLERRYGRADADRRIAGLHAVWVSHMHADHHGGLYPLLLRRQALLQQQQGGEASAAGSSSEPLLVIGPFPLFRVLCTYAKVLPMAFTFLPSSYFYSPGARPPPAAALAAYERVKGAAGLSLLQPFPVQHVANSSGLQVVGASGWKVVFSGDTRPCQAVIDAAQGATLLVHEATFEDELQDEAVAKKHSTTAEALGVAAAAGAYRTLLTHFSTRYPRIPVMRPPPPPPDHASDAASGRGGAGAPEGSTGGSDLAALGSVLVGFDLMTVNLADLAWMPKMLPVLDELFKEEAAAYQDEGDGGGEGGGVAE